MTQKENYASRSADIFIIIFFFCSQNVSSRIILLVCCTFTRNMHEMKNLHENLCVCVCGCMRVCVRAYVCRGCYDINEKIKIDTEDWAVGSRLWRCKIV